MSYYIRNDPPVGTYSNPSILTSSSVRPIRIQNDASTGFASSFTAHGYHPEHSYISGNSLSSEARPGRSYVERHAPSAGHSYMPNRPVASSYLPPPDANLMEDYICCEVRLPTLADLLQHYEEHHVPQDEAKLDANETLSHDRWPLDSSSSDSETETSSQPIVPAKAKTPPPRPQLNTTAMQAAMLAMGQQAPIVPKEDAPRPFKCPVNGCNRAYKTQNGLRYHKSVSITSNTNLIVTNSIKHSHNHQHLHENSDGTFDVVGPAKNEAIDE
jgi:hypothetical protein